MLPTIATANTIYRAHAQDKEVSLQVNQQNAVKKACPQSTFPQTAQSDTETRHFVLYPKERGLFMMPVPALFFRRGIFVHPVLNQGNLDHLLLVISRQSLRLLKL